MHELSLAEAIHGTLKELCARSGWSRVRRVALKVGRLRQVDPELLAFAFGVVAKGTFVEGAELSIMELPLLLKCHACGRQASSEGTVFVCLNCGSTEVEMLSGMELIIESLEVDLGA